MPAAPIMRMDVSSLSKTQKNFERCFMIFLIWDRSLCHATALNLAICSIPCVYLIVFTTTAETVHSPTSNGNDPLTLQTALQCLRKKTLKVSMKLFIRAQMATQSECHD